MGAPGSRVATKIDFPINSATIIYRKATAWPDPVQQKKATGKPVASQGPLCSTASNDNY